MDRIAAIKAAMDADTAYAALALSKNANDAANAIAARFNEKVYPGKVASSALFETIMNRGWFAKIKLLSADTGAAESHRMAAIDALALLEDRDRELNYASAESGTRMINTLDALIAAGALDAGTKAIILSLGQNLRTRGDVLGLGEVTGFEVYLARGAV